jgi:hypothetical protein
MLDLWNVLLFLIHQLTHPIESSPSICANLERGPIEVVGPSVILKQLFQLSMVRFSFTKYAIRVQVKGSPFQCLVSIHEIFENFFRRSTR